MFGLTEELFAPKKHFMFILLYHFCRPSLLWRELSWTLVWLSVGPPIQEDNLVKFYHLYYR